MRKVWFLAQKEFYHIIRDARSLMIAVAMPIMMTFLYGYAISLDINEIKLGIIDNDHTVVSRELAEKFYASGYFIPPNETPLALDVEESFKTGSANAVMIIPKGFEEAVRTYQPVSPGIVIDGADNNFASAIENYSNVVITKFMLENLPPEVEPPQIELSVKILYNPDLKSSHFFVPGLLGIILLMISALLTSITIAREKETGTMEQLLTAPVSPVQILTGKVLPYIALAFLDGLLILLFAKFLFGVPFIGSKILLLGFGLLYVTTALSLGILISSIVKTQQVAMMLALVTTLLPSVMLSGFIFAIKNMPLPLQIISNIVSAKYFVTIIRGIMLKGSGFEALAIQGVYLILLMTVFMLIAAKKFSTRLS